MVSRLVFLVLALTGCPPEPQPPVVGSGCEAACQRMQQMECEIGRPTANGSTCFQVCDTAEHNGVDFATECLLSAPTCAAADDC